MENQTQNVEVISEEVTVKIENLGQAISILVQGVNLAQSKGVYTFGDASLINEALQFIDKTSKEKPQN